MGSNTSLHLKPNEHVLAALDNRCPNTKIGHTLRVPNDDILSHIDA
jgi:hypothetical protein